MPDDAKRELVKMLARREIPLIEDDIYGDLHFEGARPRPARAFDRHGLVMLCGSFSKTLAPGYRVGYVAPGRFRDAVERLKFAQTVATPTLPQMAVADFLENGGYERHLRRLRRRARRAGGARERGHRGALPAGHAHLAAARRVPPLGRDARRARARSSCTTARSPRGVSVAPGPIFSAKQRFASCIRVSCGFPWSEAIERGIRTLGRDRARPLKARRAVVAQRSSTIA